MEIIFLVSLFLCGAVIGSFVCCQAWRARLKEQKKKNLGKRSVCLSCGYKLRWFDNIPIVSWLVLRGKCRKCGKKIGYTEIVVEVLMAVAFLGLGLVCLKDLMLVGRIGWIKFLLMLVMFSIAGFLAIYDGKWGELPQKQLIALVACGALIAVVSGKIWNDPLALVGAVGILAGIYYILYFVSKGQLVGDGDWIMGLGFALALGDPWLALLVLFLANMMGTVVILPKMKKMKDKKIYFGPYFVIAFVIVAIIGGEISKFLIGF